MAKSPKKKGATAPKKDESLYLLRLQTGTVTLEATGDSATAAFEELNKLPTPKFGFKGIFTIEHGGKSKSFPLMVPKMRRLFGSSKTMRAAIAKSFELFVR